MRVDRRVGKESGEEGSRRGPEIDIFSFPLFNGKGLALLRLSNFYRI
jgi:hypothetical protein